MVTNPMEVSSGVVGVGEGFVFLDDWDDIRDPQTEGFDLRESSLTDTRILVF